ncbi:MAG: hypothetical protein NZ988_01980 [Thaumarchaeota archaeon]|nr:hypothetical protein [Candidatus Calditenuaceae archaeon]MDW8186805.1 hypothetical protein [Nitrososphaerota archaeon]
MDTNRELAMILDAVKKFGPRNVSLIARQTGIPRETVRVRLLHQLPKMGFRVQLVVNYFKLGLTRHFGWLKFSKEHSRMARDVLNWLGENTYLMYWGHIALRNEYLVIATPPVKWEKEFLGIFEEMSDEGIIEDQWFKRVVKYGHPQPSFRYFDFKKGTWSQTPVTGEELEDEGSDLLIIDQVEAREITQYIVDPFDIHILVELELDSSAEIVKMAKKLGIHPRVLNYHFNEHVVRKGIVAGYSIGYVPSSEADRGAGRTWLIVEPAERALSPLNDLIKEASKPPVFCQSFNVLEDKTVALHYVPTVPTTEFFGSMGRLADLLVDGAVLPLSESAYYALTYELFSERGWKNPMEIEQVKENLKFLNVVETES